MSWLRLRFLSICQHQTFKLWYSKKFQPAKSTLWKYVYKINILAPHIHVHRSGYIHWHISAHSNMYQHTYKCGPDENLKLWQGIPQDDSSCLQVAAYAGKVNMCKYLAEMGGRELIMFQDKVQHFLICSLVVPTAWIHGCLNQAYSTLLCHVTLSLTLNLFRAHFSKVQ